MKKILLVLILGMCLISLVGANELIKFDDARPYNAETQTVSIVNTMGLGRTFADIKLNTPLQVTVPVGYQKVAEFQVTNYEDYTNAIEGMKFYDINNDMKSVDRQFDYKVLVNKSKEVNDYKLECSNTKEENKSGGFIQECKENIVGTHLVYKEDWLPLEKLDFLKGEIYTIGIFTQVHIGDNIEWVMTAYGKSLDMWASFVQSSGTKIYQDIDGLNYAIITYTSNGSFNVTGDDLNVSILVVGAGGAGGDAHYSNQGGTGGGGAGGLIYYNSYSVSAGNYNVVVGSGVAGGKGQDSSFGALIAYGGGGPGGAYGGAQTNGIDGGSGSGAGGTVGATHFGGAGVPGQGYKGADSCSSDAYAGGGGGSSQAGECVQYHGWGGNGTQININGVNTYYAGGGAGCPWDAASNYIGGLGGGGSCFALNGTYTMGSENTGGGGSAEWGTAGSASIGGSGIVIIRYAEPTATAPTVTLNSPENYFNTSNANINFNTDVFEYNSGGVITNVTLYIDGVANETDTSGINGTYIFNKTLSEGTHTWSILAFNNNSLSTQSATRNLNISFPVPVVVLNSPINYFNTSNPTITFNASVADSSSIQNVSLYIDGVLNETNSTIISPTIIVTPAFQCYQETANASNINDGSCGLNYGGGYEFTTITTNKIGYAYINYSKPMGTYGGFWEVKHGNGTNLQDYNISIPLGCWNYNSNVLILRMSSYNQETFSANSTAECYDGTWNQIGNYKSDGGTGDDEGLWNYQNQFYDGNWNTYTTFYTGQPNPGWGRNGLCAGNIYEEAMWWNISSTNISIPYYTFTETLSDGNHNWSIEAFNIFSKSNVSETRYLTVNTTPQLTLNAPVNNEKLNYINVFFNSTVNGVYDVANVTLYINGTQQGFDNSGISGGYSFPVTLNDGYYTWNEVACSSLGGCNYSETRTLTIDTTPFIEFLTPPTLVNYANTTNETVPMAVNVSTEYFKNLTYYIQNVNGTSFTHFYEISNVTFYDNFTNLPDAHYHYNVTICTTTDKCNSTETRHLNHDTTPPEINIITPLNQTYFTNFTTTDNVTVSFQWNTIDSHNESCWDSQDGGITNRTIVCNSSNDFYFPYGTHTLTAWANDTFGNTNRSDITFTLDYRLFQDAITYTNPAFSGNNELFSITMNKSSALTISSVNLMYNNISYPASFSGSSNYQTISPSIFVPTVTANTNYTFYFSFLFSDGIIVNSSFNTQQVNTFNVTTSCSADNTVLFNFTMVDEESLTKVNGTIELLYTTYALGTQNVVSIFNTSLIYNTILANPVVCIPILNKNYSFSYEIRHFVNSSYFTRYRNVQYMTLSNQTIPQNITLYNLLVVDGQVFTLRVSGNAFADNGNLLVNVEKQYIPPDTYPTIEGSITNSNGESVAHLIPNSAIYNFVVSQNGVILGIFNRNTVQCVNSICSLPLNLNSAQVVLPDYNSYGSVNGIFSTDNISRTVSFNFASTDSTTHNVTIRVLRNDDSFVCSSSLISSSGTVSCVIPATYQNATFIAQAYSNGLYLDSNTFSFFAGISKADYYGVDILIELLMYTTLVLLFMSNPVLIVVGAILGLFFGVTLISIGSGGWLQTISIIIYFVFAGVAVIWQINKKT